MELQVIDIELELHQIPVDRPFFGFVVFSYSKEHYIRNMPLYIILRDLIDDRYYAINYSSIEQKSLIREILHEITDLKSVDFNSFYIPFGKQTVDMRFDCYLQTNQINEDLIHPLEHFYKHLVSNDIEINILIPLTKHIEIVEQYYQTYGHISTSPEYLNYYQSYQRVCSDIMMNGIKMNSILTQEVYNQSLDRAYTWYNLYTLTGRPSNRFNGINFAAIPKHGLFRQCYEPDRNAFFELDFNAYHIILIASLVGYEFRGYPYTELAEVFARNGKETTLQNIKETTFNQIYGGVDSQYLSHPFFEAVYNLQNQLWSSYQSMGYIESPITGRKITIGSSVSKTKLFNYFIQLMETERNFSILATLDQNLLKHVRLYTYDAILLDLDSIEELRIYADILSENNKYPVSCKSGPNYGSLNENDIY